MVASVIDRFDGLDILINNAGIQIPADSCELAIDDFDKVLGVNLRGAHVASREAIQHFLATNHPGVIRNISNVHQIIPQPRFLSYSISTCKT
jgi:glucose 1-dehydrogenase